MTKNIRPIHDIAKNPAIKSSYGEILKIIAKNNKGGKNGVGDSTGSLTLTDINSIKYHQETIIKNNYNKTLDAGGYGGFRTTEDVVKSSIIDTTKIITNYIKVKELSRRGVGDSYENDIIGVGTGIDPTSYSRVTLPIYMSPYEGSALYSNGGLAQIILNKKAKGILLNGFEFEGDIGTDNLKRLKDHAIKVHFDTGLNLVDALVFGGAFDYPVFKKDSDSTFIYSLENLCKEGIADTNQINRWVSVDRWNTVMIPSYNITAEDYLNPQTVYIPISGTRVNTERAAMIKPTKLPYWAAITQLGWSTSDYVGYYKDLQDYKIVLMQIPILFQQMSLLFQLLPLDQVLMVSGTDKAAEIADWNEKKLREASILHPKALNSIGDIKVIDRTFTGAEPLIRMMRQNLCANAYMQEKAIFDAESSAVKTGKDALYITQSEGVKMAAVSIAPDCANLVKLLLIDCFGRNSKEALEGNVRITFNPATVLSETEKAEKGLKAAQYIQTLVSSGWPVGEATESAKQYFNFEVTEEILNKLKTLPRPQDVDRQSGQPGMKNAEKNHNVGGTKYEEKDKYQDKEDNKDLHNIK